MGIELARAFVSIRGDSTGLAQDLSNTESTVNTSMLSIAAGASSIMMSFAAFGKNIIRQGIGAASQFEKTTIEMETLIGNAKETKTLMADLTEFAVKTPFEMPGILQVTTGLLQFGERGKELMGTLQMLGDASSGDAQKFQLLGLVFNQIRGVGKLLTQDFRQLSTRGIISLQDIAKYYKKTTNEAQNMLSSGKITFADFKKILGGLTSEGGRFYNMMVRQSQSVMGLTSTLSDAWNIAVRTIAVPMIPYYKGLLNVMIECTNWIESFVRNGGEAVSMALAGATAFAIFGGTIFSASFAMKLFGMTTKGVLIGSGIGIAIIALGAGIGILTGFLMRSVTVQEAFAQGWEKIRSWAASTYEEITRFMKRNEAEFEYIQALITEIFANLTNVVIDFSEWASEYISWFSDGAIGNFTEFAQWAITSLWKILEYVAIFTNNWSLSWSWLQVQATIALFMIADQATVVFNTLLALAIGAGAGIWSAMKDTAYNIGTVFQTVISTIASLFKGLWAGIKSKFEGGDFLKSFEEEFTNQLAKIDGQLRPVGENAAKAFTKGMSDNLGDDSPFKTQIDTLKTVAGGLWDAMVKDREMNLEIDENLKDRRKPAPDLPTRPEKAGSNLPQIDLKEGRYGFAAFGNKLQDSFFGKGKDQIAQKQLSVAEMGLKKQDEILKATQGIGNVGGLGP